MSGCYLQNILYTPKNAAKLPKGYVAGHIQQEDFKKNTNSPAIQSYTKMQSAAWQRAAP